MLQKRNDISSSDWKNQYCKNAAVPTAISGLSTLPVELSMTFFSEQHKSILNFVWNHNNSRIATNALIKKENKGDIILRDFRNITKLV